MSDLLVKARIYSFDQGEKPFPAMLVRDGKVAQLFSEPPPYSGAILDLGRSIICPAFIDSHTHPLELGLTAIFPNLNSAETLGAVYDLLSSGARRADEFGFLLGFNLEPGNIKGNRMPNRKELDLVIHDRPMLVYRIDGHSAALNSRGLELVFKGNLRTEGIELDSYFEPTGLLSGPAYELASRAFKKLIPAELKQAAFREAGANAVRNGVLTIGAFVGSDEPGDDIPELLVNEAPRLPVEAVVYAQTRSIARVRKLGLPRIGGCLLIDGSFGSHTAALLENYADSPSNPGKLYFTDPELAEFLKSSNDAGLQVAVHAIGDRAVQQVADCYDRFLKGNLLRHRIEHAELLNDTLIQRIGRLGLLLGVQPAFEHYWGGKGKMYETRLGSRYRETNPYRQLLDAGIPIAGGSDAPITPLEPVLGIRAAINHPVPGHRVTPLQACRMFTDWAAFPLGLERRKGTLSPGADADFVVLSADPLTTRDFKVLEVYRAGVKV